MAAVAGEGGMRGYYALCMVWASWAVLAKLTGPPNNGVVGLLRGPPPPGRRVDNAPVLAAARRGNNRIIIP
jgi:hypothetical protein